MASDINNGTWAFPINIEHDLTLPPLGKSLSAIVEPTGDNEFRLVASGEIFDEPRIIELPNGSIGYLWQSKSDSRPFKSSEKNPSDSFIVSYGHGSFGTDEEETEFLEFVSRADRFENSSSPFLRRSVDPGSLLLIVLPLATLVATKTADKFADRISGRFAIDLVAMCDIVRAAVTRFSRAGIDYFRIHTVVITSPGTPEVEFVAKIHDAQQVISALTDEKLQDAFGKAIDHFQLVDAQKIQFILNDLSEWEFNFLMTGCGQIIGSEASYTRQIKRIQLAERPSNPPPTEIEEY